MINLLLALFACNMSDLAIGSQAFTLLRAFLEDLDATRHVADLVRTSRCFDRHSKISISDLACSNRKGIQRREHADRQPPDDPDNRQHAEHTRNNGPERNLVGRRRQFGLLDSFQDAERFSEEGAVGLRVAIVLTVDGHNALAGDCSVEALRRAAITAKLDQLPI